MTARGRSETMLVTRADGDRITRRPDDLVVEEPLTIQLDGTAVATTMRTPGHDFELAVGFCHGDGLLSGAPVRTVRYCAGGSASDGGWNVVTVDTGGVAPAPRPRIGNTSSSCGLCGNDAIDELCDRLVPFTTGAAPDLAMVRAVPERALATQALFARTGAVHGASVFDADGSVVLTREDVGRHNAVDKVVGRMLLDQGGLPVAAGLGLFVSGRASFEMVQKAWAAGFGMLVSVSAPTALAVHTARRANMWLAGFARGDRLNVYSPERP